MTNGRKVIGVGETILDILFRGGQPVAAVPGGSSFNSIISVGRASVPCTFVGYTGADHVGEQTVEFLRSNGVGTEHFQMFDGEHRLNDVVLKRDLFPLVKQILGL